MSNLCSVWGYPCPQDLGGILTLAFSLNFPILICLIFYLLVGAATLRFQRARHHYTLYGLLTVSSTCKTSTFQSILNPSCSTLLISFNSTQPVAPSCQQNIIQTFLRISLRLCARLVKLFEYLAVVFLVPVVP